MNHLPGDNIHSYIAMFIYFLLPFTSHLPTGRLFSENTKLLFRVIYVDVFISSAF